MRPNRNVSVSSHGCSRVAVPAASAAARDGPHADSVPGTVFAFFLPISIVVSPIRKNRDTFAGRVAGGDMPLGHVAKIAFWQQVWPAGMACRHAAQRPAAAPAATRP